MAYTRGLKIFYRDGKLRSGSNMGIWETALFQPSKPLAQPMADKLTSNCPRDTFYFEDYSALDHTGATWQWQFPGAAWVSSPLARNPKVVFREAARVVQRQPYGEEPRRNQHPKRLTG